MKSIDIIFSSDNNYAQHLGVALCSIFENKSNRYLINIYVIDGGISTENKSKLKILENKYSFIINYLYLKTEDYQDLYISDHISQATYYRILIPELLDKKINKILYLDCDLIVLGDIIDLFEINIYDYSVAAVEEQLKDIKIKLGMSDSTPYFNAGVMLINLIKWRELNISKITLNLVRNKPEILTFWDQDALNVTLADKCIVLDRRFNLLNSGYKNISNINNPVIIHFSSSVKPWLFNGRNPFDDKYFYYLNITPWRNKIYHYKIVRNILIESNKFLRFIIRKIIPVDIKEYLKKVLK